MDEIVFRMDCLYDYLNYPYPGTNTRTFGTGRKKTVPRQERTKLMKDEELLGMHGDLGTFIVRAVDTAEIEEKPEEEPSWF